MTQEKRKRGRPPGSGKKKEIAVTVKPEKPVILNGPVFDQGKIQKRINELGNHEVIPFEENAAYDQPKPKIPINDEPAKYQTAPMSNWAIENRKRKLGLKD